GQRARKGGTERSGAKLSPRVFGTGDHQYRFRILDRRAAIRAAAKAPRRKRPCRSRALLVDPFFWALLRSTHFCEGIDHAWGMEGITACFEPTHGETQDGLSTATSSSVTLPCGARRISWPPLAARSPCLRSAAAFPADLRYACGPSSPVPAPRARLARCVAAPPSD